MTFTFIFLAAFFLSFGMRYWLAQRQMRHVAQNRNVVPSEFATRISLAEHQKAADYTIAKLRLGTLENILSAFVLIAFTLLGGLEYLNQLITQGLGVGITQQMVLLCSIFLITGVLDLPFAWYKQFKL